MAGPEIIGRTDCDTCGTHDGMRFTRDKNGDPFGYCDVKCGQQKRVGGCKYRVSLFVALHPWAAPVTGTAPAPAPAAAPVAAPEPVPAHVPAPAPEKPKAGWLSGLEYLGGAR